MPTDTERYLLILFRKLCDAVGFEYANILYDKHGLNSDYPKTEADVRTAEQLLEEYDG